MKKFINRSLALLLAAAALSSCLKDDSAVLDPGKSAGNVVEFGNTGTPSSPSGAPVFVYTPITLDPAVTTATISTSVQYSGAENVAPTDITVNLEAAPEAITKWNAAYPTAPTPNKYNQLPAGSFSFPASVVIKKGERVAKFDITVKTGSLNPAQSNVLGIKIASASSGIISGNFGTVIYNLPIKSIWEGTYTFIAFNNYGGRDGNYPAAGYSEPDTKLATIGPNRVKVVNISGIYGGSVEYQFNGDNTAITETKVVSGANTYATSVEASTLNTATKSFSIRFTWGGRGIEETWTRTGD